jgi:DNA replication protein DnaC
MYSRYYKMRQLQTKNLAALMKWHDVIGEKTMADAILDRIVHQAHRIELSGESMRK